MNKVELIQLIQKILRQFPRHGDIIALCEACTALAMAKPVTVAAPAKSRMSRAVIQRNYRQRVKAAASVGFHKSLST